MSILVHSEIIKAIKNGEIKIEPFDLKAVGAGSIDLSLSNKFRIFKNEDRIFDVTEDLNYEDLTTAVEQESIVIHPGETILGITIEKVSLSPGICGWLEGRSRFSRLGLLIHITASFMHPGIDNHQVLEISNIGHASLRLHAGTKICQFVFERTEGKACYHGRFENQKQP